MAVVPIVDIFAGPGGLGEGFSRWSSDDLTFKIALSIEKDPAAHKTLLLRAFFRQFKAEDVPQHYYDYLAGLLSSDELFDYYPKEAGNARKEAWLHTLKDGDIDEVKQRAKAALAEFRCKEVVLIGGPPCQAYSVAGRARMYHLERFQEDERHFLYTHYLRLVAHLTPAVFVMENVKGMLTAAVNGESIYSKILEDLEFPGLAVKKLDRLKRAPTRYEYDIYSLVAHQETLKDELGLHVRPLKPQDYIIKSEDYGIPQRRHRVILMGVRKDLDPQLKRRLEVMAKVSVKDVLNDLPPIRSGVTKRENTWSSWFDALCEGLSSLQSQNIDSAVFEKMKSTRALMVEKPLGLGRKITARDKREYPRELADWYLDPKLGVVCSHEAKSHMKTDLWRYLFATSFAAVYGRSPLLKEYPNLLLPAHKNIDPQNKESARFVDRFKVQTGNEPASTVTSHISKDGHFFIHHDPIQCRAWSVREAARVQTFPDNYLFEGNKTQQYHQVGNAVPPLLAYKIADIVGEHMSVIIRNKNGR